jgi:hypothetical protein
MEQPIPSAEEIRAVLAPLSMKQLDELGRLSGVPATTIYKIKRGETENPGVETLRKFMPFVAQLLPPSTALAALPEHPSTTPREPATEHPAARSSSAARGRFGEGAGRGGRNA